MVHRRIVAAAVLAGVCLALSGCSDDGESSEPVVVASGAESGHPWTLTAWKSYEGELCLGLDTEGDVRTETAACGFSDDPTSGRYLSWEGGGQEMVFGPVPSAAVTVNLTGTGYTIAPVRTLPLPASAASGRFFVARVPGPGATVDIEARDGAGRILPVRDF